MWIDCDLHQMCMDGLKVMVGNNWGNVSSNPAVGRALYKGVPHLVQKNLQVHHGKRNAVMRRQQGCAMRDALAYRHRYRYWYCGSHERNLP